jgi:hypothetical protein
MTVIAGNLRLGVRDPRRLYLGSALVFAAEQTRWETDFGEYATGSPPSGWTSYDSGSLDIFEVASGGLISDRCLRIRQDTPSSGSAYAFFLWNILPEVEDSEILMLVSRGASNNLNNIFGAVQRLTIASGTSHSGLFSGLRGDTTDVTKRRVLNTSMPDGIHTAHGGSFGAGDAFWLRARWEGSNYGVRGWAADTLAPDLGLASEPSSWQLDGTYSNVMGNGKTGILQRAYSSTAVQSEIFVHYFGVGIDGDSAPVPVLAPPPPPSPAPDPGPDPSPDPDPGTDPIPGTFQTFDSTATSFDCSIHTFDEVA